jgi:hypothetical protein
MPTTAIKVPAVVDASAEMRWPAHADAPTVGVPRPSICRARYKGSSDQTECRQRSHSDFPERHFELHYCVALNE